MMNLQKISNSIQLRWRPTIASRLYEAYIFRRGRIWEVAPLLYQPCSSQSLNFSFFQSSADRSCVALYRSTNRLRNISFFSFFSLFFLSSYDRNRTRLKNKGVRVIKFNERHFIFKWMTWNRHNQLWKNFYVNYNLEKEKKISLSFHCRV